jgi:hypothetical protein
MVQIEHTLKFVTEFDETHPTAQGVLSLPDLIQVQMLEEMLLALVAPKLQPILDELNEHNSFAILKVVK